MLLIAMTLINTCFIVGVVSFLEGKKDSKKIPSKIEMYRIS